MRRSAFRYWALLFLFFACDGQDAGEREAELGLKEQALANDADGDGVVDSSDNCPKLPNANQANSNGAGPGDACEVSLVLSPGLLNQYARFQSHKELLLNYAPLSFALGPDLMKISAKAPNGAFANYYLLTKKLGVASPNELLTNNADSIGGSEVLSVGLGSDGVLGGGKATDVYLRLSGNATVSVAFFEGNTARGTQTLTNNSTGLRRFAPSGGVLFDRVEIRSTSGKVSLVGPNEAVMFALGQAQLPCPSGYERVGTSCVDINECSGLNHICDALTSCTNTQGSYSCGPCPAGYTGTGATTCVDIDECANGGAQCSTLVTCSNTAGGYQCGACPAGFRGDGHSCSDIDECEEESDACDPLVACTNRAGGYDCGSCPAGYSGGGTSGCVDIDECTGPDHVCNSLATCSNSPGSYACGPCPSGYRGDGRTCTDIDECSEGTAQCSPLVQCGNTTGGYQCGACPSGFNGDGRICTDIDECAAGSAQCAPGVTCTNAVGSYTCGPCPSGYSGDGVTCTDIDECASAPCDPRVSCTNAPAGFSCGACPAGFRGDGYAGCIDVDECAEDLDTCSALVTCGNTLGGYACGACPAGYGGDGHTCTDLDECALHTAQCDVLVTCTNTVGGYTCGECPSGYSGDGHTCTDIDECSTAPCHPLTACTNTAGSYACSACPAGYQGDGYAGCLDVDECAVSNGGCPHSEACVNTLGSRNCVACAAGSTGVVTYCGVGACAATGTTSCSYGTVLDSCTPGLPAASDQTCDNVDDDCNASADDGFVSHATNCGSGACAATGMTSCVAGVVRNSCTPRAPASSDATCNGVDDDCSGTVDEDYASQSTSCGVGGCARTGTTSCVSGSEQDSCTPGSPASSDATCDGIDQDCNGVADQDYASAVTPCGTGVCAAQGATACVAGVVMDSCSPGTPAATDGCGGGDEDCDGYVDEDCCTPTTCAGQQATCGTVSDGCSGTLDCGTCAAPETCGGGGTSNVCGVADLPPPASEVAPPVTSDRPPTPYEAISYLFTGPSAIQSGVQPGAIAPHSVVAVRGRVLTVQQAPLAGARVSVSGHPELGFTYSRNDGTYDLAFNGGVAIALEVTRPGYLPVQRLLQEDWQTQAVVDDVVLTQLGPINATINPSLPIVQTVQGTLVTDDSGPRQPLLLIPPGTNPIAEVNGQSVPLDTMTIRITEYTVGSTGLLAMPAALPPTSAYTYAMELSVDEVGPTTSVRFARPLPYYLDNFVGFPVGSAVPVGYYDRKAGFWVPEEDGIVLRIHAIVDGVAALSVDDADPNPASEAVLSSLGIEPWERERLAALYPAGKTLWRAALRHFTPWDLNAGFFAPKPADPPKPAAGVQVPTCTSKAKGSIINCQGRVLMEEIPLGDTGLTLHYQSDRTPGGVRHLNEIEIPLPEQAPEGTRQVEVEISVGRRLAQWVHLPVGTPSYRYMWDGKDADGRPWPGPIEITVGISFDVDLPYMIESRLGGVAAAGPPRSFGGSIACPAGCDCLGSGQGAAMDSTRVRNARGSWWAFERRRHKVGGHTNSAYGLGGWSLTNHHHYSPLTRELYLGTGGTRRFDTDEVQGVVPFAGMGSDAAMGDEVDNDHAFSADLAYVRNVAGSPDGHVYFQMEPAPGAAQLWAVTPENKLRRVLPEQNPGKLLTVDPQGRPYLAYGTALRRLEQTSDGVRWTRMAGAPQPGDPDYSTQPRPDWSDGSPVREVAFLGFLDAAVSRDGITYLLAQVRQPSNPSLSMNVLLRVGADGRGQRIFTPFTNSVRGIELDAQQRLLIVDQQFKRILRLQPSGQVETVAGGGTITGIEPHMAFSSRLGTIGDLTVAPNGTIYFINDGVLRSVDAKGVIWPVCLSEVPKSPYYTQASVGPQACGLPTYVTSLPDGRLIVAETLERRLVALNGWAASWPYREPSLAPTDTFDIEKRCLEERDGKCRNEVEIPHYYSFRYGQYAIPSEDGSEIYVFDDYGQHRSTTDARSGRLLVSFSYDSSGRLTDIYQPGAGPIKIGRGSLDGLPPGSMKFIALNGNEIMAADLGVGKHLVHVESPFQRGWSMTYQADGLLTSFWDRRGNRAGNQAGTPYRFTWEEVRPQGVSPQAAGITMLRTDTDPSGAMQTLSTNPGQPFYEPIYGGTWCGTPVITGWDFGGQTTIVTRDTAEGRRTTYRTLAAREYRDPAVPATRYIERTASVTHPSGATEQWTDKRPDGTVKASGPGWSSTSAETHQRTTSLSTRSGSRTTTLDALSSDGSAPSATRPALTQTNTSVETREYGPPTEPPRTTVRETFTQTSPFRPTRTSTRVFDSSTLTTTTTSAEQRSWAFVQDRQGRLTEIRAPGQVPTVLHYDASGNLGAIARHKGAGVRVTGFSNYDPPSSGRGLPRLITSRVSNTQSTSVSLGYSNGFIYRVGVTGATPTTSTPDESQLPVAITPPARPAHTMGYDTRGLAVSYAPPGQTATEDPSQCPSGTQCVSYNGDRQVRSIRLTDGTALVYDYAAATGLLRAITVPGSGDTTFVYDTVGRLSSATAPDGAAVTLAYQASLPVRSRWSGTHAVKDGSTTVWSGTLDGDVKAFYNGFSDLDTLQVVGGYHARFVRDMDGLITGITNAAGGTSVPALTLTRSPLDGSVTSTAVGNVATTQQLDVSATAPGYGDLIGLGASFGATALFATAYEHDDLGRITQLSETVQGTTRVRRYEYDAAGRLTHVRDDQDLVQAHYQYDENGNRTQATVGSETQVALCPDGRATNDLDQLCDYAGTHYVYDEKGALLEKDSAQGTTSYTYDGLGSLKKVILPSGDVIHYVHDAMGRRIGKLRNGQLVKGWLYADGLRPIAQLNAAGQLEATYVYGSRANAPDLIVENTAGNPITYRVVADHLGTPRLVVRVSDGAVVHRLDLDEFGNVVSESGARQDLHPFGFAAGLRDRDTGLVRFGARDYDPYTGRWTARDPVLFDGGDSNLYAYVGNDPVNLVDPAGTDAWSAAGSFAEGVAWSVAGGIAISAALASGTVVGGLAATALIGYGAYSGAMALNDVINGRTSEDRLDAAAGLAGGLLGGGLSGWGFRTGHEFTGNGWRVAPWGNRTGNAYGEYPHYHRRIPHSNPRRARKGESAPGGSIDRHRPWEPAGSDKSWCDQF